MYVYIRAKDDGHTVFVVGFYDPQGKWHPESDHETKEAAAQRCHWLNGGNTTTTAPDFEAYLERYRKENQ